MKPTAKRQTLEKLRELLDTVPGTTTPWGELEDALAKLSERELRALQYRVERARAQSYEEGEARRASA